jgi:hypothetical protein
MSWLKRHDAIILSQSSEIPYVILENGVFLCFDNLYGTDAYDSEHSIKFIAYPNDISRQSTNYFKLKQFPKIIPFEEILSLDNIITNGKLLKIAQDLPDDSKSVLVAKSKYTRRLNENKLQDFIDMLDEYDKTFLLVGDEIDEQSRILEDDMTLIHHRGWYPTSVSIAHHVCGLSSRKWCWTKSLPELDIVTLGLKDSQEMRRADECLSNIGVTNKEIIWRG